MWTYLILGVAALVVVNVVFVILLALASPKSAEVYAGTRSSRRRRKRAT